MTEKVDVTVDAREPKETVETVESHPAVGNVTVDVLPAGDLAIRGVGFERKTWSDYANALTSDGERSLGDQVAKLKQVYDTAYLLVEGDLADTRTLRYSRINPRSLTGSAASITARDEIPVIPVSDPTHLIRYATQLARKHTDAPSSPQIGKGAVGRDNPTVMRMYGCLPNVGPELAESLYERYPEIQQLLDAPADEIAEIDRIGPKRAASIKAGLEGDDAE